MNVPEDVTAEDLHAAWMRGDLSAVEIADAALARVAAGGDLHAFLAVDADRMRDRARDLDRIGDRRQAGPLAAIPVAIKDNICTAGLATTAGSRILDGYVPPYDATAVRRLRDAGALILGKTNCDEFAMGSSTEYSARGVTRNPWDRRRTPGGSSGGSAAAVAARLVPVALGSDTGGSVRQPAGFCGIVGIKPTYGRVSRYGLIAFASSLDQIGAFGVTVHDAARMLQAIAGPDPLDATAHAGAAPEWLAGLAPDVRGLRLGVPSAWLDAGAEPDVAARVRDALDVLRACGASIVDVDVPDASLAVPIYYLLATAEASSNLARYDGVRYGARDRDATTLAGMYTRTRGRGFGPEVKRRILLGTFVLSAGYYDRWYVRARRARARLTRDFEHALSGVTAIITPTSPTTAFLLGERLEDPVRMYAADAFTAGASLAGLPALSVPCGFDAAGLPVGLQIVGRRWDEAAILRVAAAYERERPWWRRTPGAGAGV